MKSEFLNKKAQYLSDEQIYSCVGDTIFNGLRMLSLQSKLEHARLVFEGILPIIRNRFNDFTMNDIDSAIKSGSYGEYGDYSKMNPKTIMDWFNKKRIEVSINNERFSKDEKRVKEDSIIPCVNGGSSVILGLFYSEKGFEMSFQDRLKLIDTGKPCPFTGKKVNDIIRDYKIEFRLEKRR